jgi:2-octaprenyl-3-methyl-6-methoxy-1,4-benzoquinol hydroxylase/2-octaprenylphenol hydroxylase
MLWRALEADPHIALHCPAQVVATEADDDRRTLVLADNSRVAARLVVAADGGDSALRKMAGIETRDRDYGQRAIVAHVATERAHEDTAWQRFLPGATLAFLPLSDGRSSIVWSVPEAEASRLLALEDGAFRAELGAAFDFRLGVIQATTARAAFPLRLRLAEQYLAERLTRLATPRTSHPLAGQGVNPGLRDANEPAFVLVEARDAKRDFASRAVALAERRRRSDNALGVRVRPIARGASEAMPLAAFRGAASTAVDWCPFLPRRSRRPLAPRRTSENTFAERVHSLRRRVIGAAPEQ